MINIDEDIDNTFKLIDGRETSHFSPVYFSTNECLDDIFSYIDVEGKNVLSVIGSGDQAFHLYDRGAKKVDLFDINKMAFYYYYLRLWTMRYLKKSYPDYNMNTKYIESLLELVEVKSNDEKNAYNYWKKFVNSYDVRCSDFLFISSFLDLDEHLYDDSGLFEKIEKYQPRFYHIDIAGHININSKYDIIYTSKV